MQFLIFWILATLVCREATAEPTEKAPTKIVFVGDSLTEGYGLPMQQAYPHLLGAMLAAGGRKVEIVNAAESGSTSASALARVRWILKGKPHVVVLALGANDALRGLSTNGTSENLRQAIALVKASGVKLLLVGMQAPPNMGAKFTKEFNQIFPQLAQQLEVALVPFLLAGVGGVASMNQADGIHPNLAGQERMARNLLPYLEKLL